MSISNTQVITRCNEELRPMADSLASLCLMSDKFITRFTDPSILTPLGITTEMLFTETLPSEDDFPDENILDGAEIDGRPILTKRKLLKLLRIILQLNAIKNATQYGIEKYTQSVALGVCVNIKG